MLKYLIVPLSDDAVPFCHWISKRPGGKLMPIDILDKAIKFAMKENLVIQFAYPKYTLPTEYHELIDTIEHVNIKPISSCGTGDLAVSKFSDLAKEPSHADILTITCTLEEFTDNTSIIIATLKQHKRVNIIIDNISNLGKSDIPRYTHSLDLISDVIAEETSKGRFMQCNLLTDRIALTEMNNCNAGIESIAICPDGKFYLCPGFYFENMEDLGSIDSPLTIKNKHLLHINNAPICSHCDAYHCKRCVKLNRQLTLEVNTPGKEQCVMAHIERNASKRLLSRLQTSLNLFTNIDISTDTCLDPFEQRLLWDD